MLPENPNKNIEFNINNLKTIYLAGGCFWGTEAFVERLFGVYETQCGYANGNTQNPTYEEVCRQNTGHAETVFVKYDPEKISLTKLLHGFFETINPTSVNKQGGDVGSQYRTGIYYTDAADRQEILDFITEKQKEYDKPIATEVMELQNYYPAEEYHQKYLEKNPGGYCHINLNILNDIQ